ncbi:hypothetical protein NC652_024735 [Populus alba x Populus x berolinensis]|nr:hypothetical protein NC652_024735 [Populus alba x Populus x berolinensis]
MLQINLLVVVVLILGLVRANLHTVEGKPRRILLDTDVDTDDFFALLYLLKLNRSEFELEFLIFLNENDEPLDGPIFPFVLGFTINTNAWTDAGHAVSQIYDMLYMMGRDDVSVGMGGRLGGRLDFDANYGVPASVNENFFKAFEQNQHTYEAQYCFQSLKMARDTWFDDQFYTSYFMWDSFMSGVAVSTMRTSHNQNGENEFGEMEYMNITVVTSNEPYEINDCSNPLFDDRQVPKFNLKKVFVVVAVSISICSRYLFFFHKENLIGEGGYAEVYKGKLEDGQFVAIKRLTRGSPEDMTVDFLSELGIIVHVDHPNIAKVIGYGVEGGMHLVLELSANGSLASLLYDFGLAKWLPEEWSHHTLSKIEGTFGFVIQNLGRVSESSRYLALQSDLISYLDSYLPPEFFMHGIVDEKTDVYAYGVLLLELITGRQALDSSQQSLVMWAKPLLLKNSIEELVDPILVDAYDSEQMDRLACTASMCIHQSPSERPQMSQVVRVLQGDESSFEELKQRQRTPSIEDLYDADENDSTEYLSDLNQQMEVVLSNCNEKSEEHGRSTECLDDPNQQEEGVAVLNRSGI